MNNEIKTPTLEDIDAAKEYFFDALQDAQTLTPCRRSVEIVETALEVLKDLLTPSEGDMPKTIYVYQNQNVEGEIIYYADDWKSEIVKTEQYTQTPKQLMESE